LVIHGDADRILPIAASGHRTAKLIKGARLLVVKDGPHCITWTHAEQVNGGLLEFLGKDKGIPSSRKLMPDRKFLFARRGREGTPLFRPSSFGWGGLPDSDHGTCPDAAGTPPHVLVHFVPAEGILREKRVKASQNRQL